MKTAYKGKIKNTIFKDKLIYRIEHNCSLDWYHFITEKISSRTGYHKDLIMDWMGMTNRIDSILLHHIFLKELAKEFDKCYSDIIQDSSDIYVISTVNFKIGKIHRNKEIKYQNFAAFRTYEDARIAREIWMQIYNDIFIGNDMYAKRK